MITLALVLRACVIEPVRVTDESMSPEFQEGDVVLVSKLRYGLRVPGGGAMLLEWGAPQHGDLVVAVAVGDPPLSFLRRVVAIPGDKVTLPDGKEATLKEGEYFLQAEQKEGVDSRKIGVVSQRAIIGKASYLWIAKKSSTASSSQVESSKFEWRILKPL